MRLVLVLLVAFPVGDALAGGCVETATQACLQGGRFAVTLDYDLDGASFAPASASPRAGPAQKIAFGDDTVLFTFYDAEQMDAYVSVLEGCPFNDRYWVFAAGATDAGVTLRVTDTVASQEVSYSNPAGTAFVPVQDTAAFATCPALATGGKVVKQTSPPALDGAGCGGLFCLQGNRFQLDIDWRDFSDNTGSASAAATLDHSGLAWFFSAQSPESLSTVIDGLADNGSFWFLASSTTQVEANYHLTDTQTGLVNTYMQPLGTSVTFLDRGEPLATSLMASEPAPLAGESMQFELLIDNPAPTLRPFEFAVAPPSNVSNPRYTCMAQFGATCPMSSGTDAIMHSGSMTPGGRLRYLYEVDLPLASIDTAVTLDAEVTTGAHALSVARTEMLDSTVDVTNCTPGNQGLGITSDLALDGTGSLLVQTQMQRAFVQNSSPSQVLDIAFTADFSCVAALSTSAVPVLSLANPQAESMLQLQVLPQDALFASGMESRHAQIIPSAYPPGPLDVLYQYDLVDGTVRLTVNGGLVSEGQSADLAMGPTFSFLRLGYPRVTRGAGGLVVIDNFSMTQPGQPMPDFFDDFESGDLSRWDVTVP